jgi:hypothetical protein
MAANIWVPEIQNVPVSAQEIPFSASISYTSPSVGLALLGRGISVTDAPFNAIAGDVDSSAQIQAALNSSHSLIIIPSGTWNIANISIPGGKTLYAESARFNIFSGATYGFKLNGYAPKLIGAYIADGSGASEASIIIDDSRLAIVADCRLLNSVNGIKLKSSSAGLGFPAGCSRAQLSNIVCDTFSGAGIEIAANCSDGQFTNIFLDSGTIPGGAALVPKLGATGFKINSTGSVIAFGGHLLTNVVTINSQRGYHFIDTNLIKLNNCIADSHSGEGIWLQGNTVGCDFDAMFIGTTGVAIRETDTSNLNKFNGLRTQSTGIIPPWGGLTFYSSAGYSAPFYDIRLENTSKLTVNAPGWCSVGSNAYTALESIPRGCVLAGAEVEHLNSANAIDAGSTVYIGVAVASATENDVFFFCAAEKSFMRLQVAVGAAPGVGQSFTYTLRINSVDTSIVGVITGAGVFSVDITIPNPAVTILDQNTYSLKLVTSAGAAVTRHRANMIFVQRNK